MVWSLTLMVGLETKNFSQNNIWVKTNTFVVFECFWFSFVFVWLSWLSCGCRTSKPPRLPRGCVLCAVAARPAARAVACGYISYQYARLRATTHFTTPLPRLVHAPGYRRAVDRLGRRREERVVVRLPTVTTPARRPGPGLPVACCMCGYLRLAHGR